MLLLLLIAQATRAQGEIDDQVRMLFRNESSYAISLNSNGFGLNYRYGFWRNARNQFILDGEFSYTKHPKEVKTTIAYSNYETRKYVYGKKNLFWELKAYAGWQRELFRKIDKTGISVRFYYAGGLSLGFLKPIYYEIHNFNSMGYSMGYENRKFDLAYHQQNIGGRGPFFMGFSELGLLPGLSAKTGLSFEYSEKDAAIHALEAGLGLTLYPKAVPIMATESNRFLFFNLSVAYRFGRVIDISEAARAKSGRTRRKERKEAMENTGYQGF